MKKVTLVIPNSRWCGKREWPVLPYSALILTALLKDSFDFNIIDANGKNLDSEQFVAELKERKPDYTLVSGISSEYFRQIHHTFELIKSACPDSVTVLGGVYPTVLGEVALEDANIDYIFQGQAEERITEFLNLLTEGDDESISNLQGIGYRNKSGRVVINPLQTYIGSVKEMVRPCYDEIDLSPYLLRSIANYQLKSKVPSALVSTSYGCSQKCVFCASRTINGRKVAYRPIDEVIEEIEYLIENWKIEEVVFIDDNVFVKRDRAIRLMQTMIDRNYGLSWKALSVAAWSLDDELLSIMKESGCTQVTIAVESGSQRVVTDIIKKPLKIEIVPGIVKKCKELGMIVTSNFVIGFPGETWEEIRQTFDFAEQCDFDLVTFTIATPLPKTDLYEIAKENNLLEEGFSFMNEKYFGYSRGFITTDEFTPEELMTLRAYEWDRINFKSPEKTERIAEMFGIGVDELAAHRRKTRRFLGVNY